MKTLVGDSIETFPSTNETLNRGSLIIKSGDEDGTVLLVNIRKGIEVDGKFSWRKGEDIIINDASFSGFQTEFNALMAKIWDQLKTDGIIDFT